MTGRKFIPFVYKEARFRISFPAFESAAWAIRRNRDLLDSYISRNPVFLRSLVPVRLSAEAPEIAKKMHFASMATGVGPMAAVAGAFAEEAGRTALERGAEEAVVENGGDVFMKLAAPLVMGLYAGNNSLSGKLAFRIDPALTPLGICSSSGTMGHSLSLGLCDLATVFSQDTALADAAATRAANMVKTENDIERVLEDMENIPGILGILIIKGEKIGMWGNLPPIIKHGDKGFPDKITRDPGSNLFF